jgi:hypothetical protein
MPARGVDRDQVLDPMRGHHQRRGLDRLIDANRPQLGLRRLTRGQLIASTPPHAAAVSRVEISIPSPTLTRAIGVSGMLVSNQSFSR